MTAGPNDDFAGMVRRMGLTRVKHRVGAATLLQDEEPQFNNDSRGGRRASRPAYLIHMLAKHATPMNASRTVLGPVPARDSSLVTRTRSMLVLLSADAIVNPPIRSMIVDENIWENTYLYHYVSRHLSKACKQRTLWHPAEVAAHLTRHEKRGV
jgi:hypothetical protein